MKRIFAVALLTAIGIMPAWAQKEVTIAYQDMVVPYRIAQEAKEIEKATGREIRRQSTPWRVLRTTRHS